jgi:hypothetical protein
MFRATNSPILRSTFDCIYSFWYNAPTLPPTGDAVKMEFRSISTVCTRTLFHLNRVTGRQQCRCIVPKAVDTVKSAPEDGRICRPKHVGLIYRISKRNFLHLVDCLHRCSSDARSHKRHVPLKYVGNSISKLQIQVATYVFELSAGNCHR